MRERAWAYGKLWYSERREERQRRSLTRVGMPSDAVSLTWRNCSIEQHVRDTLEAMLIVHDDDGHKWVGMCERARLRCPTLRRDTCIGETVVDLLLTLLQGGYLWKEAGEQSSASELVLGR